MKSLIIANWKCNPTTLAEAKLLFNSVQKGAKDLKNIEVVICPPFVWLPYLLNPKPYTLNPKLGAQDSFWENSGAFTGEISPLMLKNLGCQYVILGHSERRRYLGETDEMINRKLKAALTAKLNPILCIGETQKERRQGKTQKILEKQLKRSFYQIPNTRYQILNTAIAYEPVWAIGKGKACLPSEAGRIGDFIRKTISQIYNKKIAKNIKILYGGSVNSQNAALYISDIGFKGLLVGGASLDSTEFIRIVKSVNRN